MSLEFNSRLLFFYNCIFLIKKKNIYKRRIKRMTYEKALSTLMNLTKDKEKKYKKKLISIKKFLIECNNAFILLMK